jgi:thymidylate synthase
MFWSERDANPFFHFFESLWMLNGNNNLDFVDYFAPMRDYSDDKKTLNGAYGFRWKYYFGFDQIQFVINELEKNLYSRRAVISMWDPEDVEKRSSSKDLCCNTQLYFDVQDGFKKGLTYKTLNMTVLNRSNDAIFGLAGANAVHFSYLQEYVAKKLDLGVGSYFQISNNCHVYIDEKSQARSLKIYKNILNLYKSNLFVLKLNKFFNIKLNNSIFDIYKKRFGKIPYYELAIKPYDFGSKEFDIDLKDFFSKPIEYYINNVKEYENYSYFSSYFKHIVKPTLLAFIYYKSYKVYFC